MEKVDKSWDVYQVWQSNNNKKVYKLTFTGGYSAGQSL